MAESSYPVTDNPNADRYEIETEEGTAILTYHKSERRIHLLHTEVPDALEGRGIGSALARHALDAARAAGLEVVPSCPFVAAYVQRHPEYAALVTGK